VKRYKGIFNYNGEVTILWRWAVSQAQAKEFFYRALAKKYDKIVWRIRNHFEGKNFYVVKEA